MISVASLFALEGPVSRATYARVGIGLTVLKYIWDAGLIYLATRHVFTPIEYLSPALSTRQQMVAGEAEWLLPVLVVTTLPFLWVGLALSLRRAVDAGRPPGLALFFLVPLLNYALMIALALLPSAPPERAAERRAEMGAGSKLRAAVGGIGLGIALVVVMNALCTLVLGEYGLALFFGTPAIMGVTSSWLYNRSIDRGGGGSVVVALLAALLSGLTLLLFAIEGVICLTMAAPLGFFMAAIGAAVGREIARREREHRNRPQPPITTFALVLPLLLLADLATPPPEQAREVRTSIVIDAPPEAVWPNVVAFAALEAPPALVYRLGVAYPLRARLVGEGVGAVRHCEFTTGAFVEPITRWEPPRRLSFDVVAQPPPMHEWSPYRHVHPPHLDGYLRSRRGEFRLIDLGGGRTRLEGSTWYTLDLAPRGYWAIQADLLIHGIHRRVLEHIARLTEGDGDDAAASASPRASALGG